MLVAGTVSKTYAMTGWRIGYGLVPEPIVTAMTKLQSHSTSNPMLHLPKGRGGSAKRPAGIGGRMLAEYRRRRDFVVQRLRAIPGVKCAEPQGAFYAYPNVRRRLARTASPTSLRTFAERLLAEAHVAVVPGEAFGVDRHIRISYAASMQNLKRGLDRIHEFMVKNS